VSRTESAPDASAAALATADRGTLRESPALAPDATDALPASVTCPCIERSPDAPDAALADAESERAASTDPVALPATGATPDSARAV
jgi:hypothetical protein